MLKGIFTQKFVFIKSQLTELDNLAFVAMVTNLPRKQKKVRLQFCLLYPYIKPRFHSTEVTLIIYNNVMKISPLYPRTSFSNNKSRNLNKGHS